MTRTAHSTPELGDPHHSHAYRLGFRPDIEGLRAIAILLVVAAHAGIDAFAGGFIGVDVFFVLSGYLITGLLLQETRQRGDVNLPAFYARRLRRLLPALVFMVLGTLALASVLLAPWEQLQQIFSAGAALLWLSNLHFAFAQLDYFGPASESNLFLHTWSLGVEEQFYLAWPVLLLLFLGRFSEEGKGLDERRLVWWIAVATAASFALSAYLTITKPIWAYYFPVTRAWQFGVGALALIWSVRHDHANAQIEARSSTQRNSMLLRWAGWLGLAAIVASSLWIDEDMPYPGTVSLIPTLGATLVLLSGTVANRGSVATLLTTRPLQAIGRVSYSWYLWHWPVLLLGMTLVPSGSTLHVAGLVVISLALAALSYHAVERPIRMAPLLARRPTITITSSAAIAAFAASKRSPRPKRNLSLIPDTGEVELSGMLRSPANPFTSIPVSTLRTTC